MGKVTPPGRTSNKRRILIVDDDNDIVSFLCDLFIENGYKPTGYTSGKEALEALKQQEFDLLLTDLMMPEMDGIEVLKAALTIAPSLGVIIMTGYSTIRTAIEARRAGALKYLVKPFDVRELLFAVSQAMEAGGLPESTTK
jgi:hypothetical protein